MEGIEKIDPKRNAVIIDFYIDIYGDAKKVVSIECEDHQLLPDLEAYAKSILKGNV